ncbi:hypothetical protein AB4Z48_14865 [Cupriavidus sp. 2TAF22]|uniref:hypothetical protein n=1 Tax=unclassified Cupriavidus TaxID=2640874 RepID=UPI003F8D9413
MKKWIVMLTLAMFGAGAYAQASAPAAPAAGDKPAASSDKMSKKPAKKKKNHAPSDTDKMMNKGA